jgi:hypothetical protein
MAFDFPSNPVLDQVYTSGGVTYTWNGYAWVKGSSTAGATGDFVLKAGDTMTGFLTLSADPVNPLHAATKQYVDGLALPLGGAPGEAFVKNAVNTPQWGAPIDGANY